MESVYTEGSLDDVDFATPMTPPPKELEHLGARFDLGFSGEVPDVLDENNESDVSLDDARSTSSNYSPPAWRTLDDNPDDCPCRDRKDDVTRPTLTITGDKLGHQNAVLNNHAILAMNDIFEAARRARLPTGSLSPEKGRSPEPETRGQNGTAVKVERETTAYSNGDASKDPTVVKREATVEVLSPVVERENYIRLALRADILQRTEPIEAAVNFVRTTYCTVTRSWASLILAAIMAILAISASRLLFQPIMNRPVPDLVKVSDLAKTFESLIIYSENSISHVSSLQATGSAVEDLSESVRTTDIASAPQIIQALDTLAENVKTLALELTKFFANVDGDIDGILMVMDWARRELYPLRGTEHAPLSMVFSNIHGVLCAAGLFENPSTGDPTNLGVLVNTMFGMSHAQRTQQTLQRTFNQFVSVLEEAIEEELQQSIKLFRLFETIDKQFQNLARLVMHERSEQEEQYVEALSSLWTRLLGPKASEVRKYESNRNLLAHLGQKTNANKLALITHNQKLMTLKSGLERTRRNLVSPLVRSVNSTTLTIEDQIKSLEAVGGQLGETRARQKSMIMEKMFGSGSYIPPPPPPPLLPTRTATARPL